MFVCGNQLDDTGHSPEAALPHHQKEITVFFDIFFILSLLQRLHACFFQGGVVYTKTKGISTDRKVKERVKLIQKRELGVRTKEGSTGKTKKTGEEQE